MARKFKGREITNALRPVRINVTDRDVAKGTPLDPENCAAAECIKRMLGADEVSVHRGVVIVAKGTKATRYMTSGALRLEEIIFDRGGRFMIGEYDLKPVPVGKVAPKPKKKSPSAPRSKKQAKLAVRRMNIPGVRRRLNPFKEEQE